jgi:CheY-like chemotaxis protein
VSCLRVLVVDDNVNAARSLACLIDLWGYDVRYALEGRSALDLAQAFRPDVVFCDIAMPGMNGCEVARRIRLRPETVGAFVVAVTAYDSERDPHHTREAGFHLHLVKPVVPEAIRSVLRNSSPSLS